MAEKLLELKNNIGENWGTYKNLMPEVGDLYDQFHGEI